MANSWPHWGRDRCKEADALERTLPTAEPSSGALLPKRRPEWRPDSRPEWLKAGRWARKAGVVGIDALIECTDVWVPGRVCGDRGRGIERLSRCAKWASPSLRPSVPGPTLAPDEEGDDSLSRTNARSPATRRAKSIGSGLLDRMACKTIGSTSHAGGGVCPVERRHDMLGAGEIGAK